MSVRYYLSSDDNAPVVSGASRTCIVNLLKKCLIEGYGDRAAVGGWTMPYSTAEGTQAVFRNDHEGGATGFCLQIDHQSPGYINSFYAGAYENMTSVSAGQFPFGWSNTQKAPAFGGMQVSNISANASRAWIVVATNKWLFLAIYYNSAHLPTAAAAGTNNNLSACLWFGDIDKLFPDDAFACMFCISYAGSAWGSGSGSSSSQIGSSPTVASYCFARPVSGEAVPFGGLAYIPHPGAGGTLGSVGPQYTAQSGLLVGRIAFADKPANTLRGWLPGALAPLHPRPFEPFVPVPIDGSNYLPVPFVSHGSTQLQYHGQILFAL